MRPLHLPFGFATKVLTGIDYTYKPSGGDGGGSGGFGGTGNPQPQPSLVFACPSNARAYLRGDCYGPAGALAYVAFGLNDLASWPGDQHGMFSDALVIPAGARFKFAVNHEQVVSGVASCSPQQGWSPPDAIVYLSFNWELDFYDDDEGHTNGGYDVTPPSAPGGGSSPAAGGITGPQPGWRKRGGR